MDLSADVVLRLPGLLLLLLVAKKFRGDPALNDRIVGPMTGPLGRSHAEDLLGHRNELDDPVGDAGRSSRIDVPRVPILVAAQRQLHHWLNVLRRRLRRRRCGSTLVPKPRGLWDTGLFHH